MICLAANFFFTIRVYLFALFSERRKLDLGMLVRIVKSNSNMIIWVTIVYVFDIGKDISK